MFKNIVKSNKDNIKILEQNNKVEIVVEEKKKSKSK